MASPTLSLTDILIRGRQRNSQVIVSGVPSRREKKIGTPDRRLTLGQRRGEMSYEDRCKLLRWSQLTDRRLYFSLIECYKLVFGLNSPSFRNFFEFASRRTRSNHNYKLQVKSANCNCYKYSFFVKIIREWNDLPANVVACCC